MIPVKEKNGYWAVVRECLIKFHGLPRQVAREKCKELRIKIESPSCGSSSEIFYHNEPFDIANHLAGHELDYLEFLTPYEQLLDAHHWGLEEGNRHDRLSP